MFAYWYDLLIFFLSVYVVLMMVRIWCDLRTVVVDKYGRTCGRRLWWHRQNLNDNAGGSMLRHGRAWIHLDRRTFRLEWAFLGNSLFKVGLGFDDDTVLVTVATPLFSIYLGLEDLTWRFLPSNRHCSVSVHDWTVWLNPWSKEGEWSRSDPWWVRGVSVRIDRIIFGEERYESRDLTREDIIIPMPEGAYPATARLFESAWSWPRWFTKRIVRSEIEIPSGIPVPGKGESSYNCDDDACYSLTCQAGTIEEAIGHLVGSILESRLRYGGSHLHHEMVVYANPRAIDNQLDNQQGNQQEG